MKRAAVLFSMIVTALAPLRAAAASPPSRMLWSWYADTDLRFLRPSQAGVAYVAASLSLSGNQVRVFPRSAELRLAPHTYEMAVVRIEYPAEVTDAGGGQARFSAAQRHKTARLIADLAAITRAPALQIDFDCPKSGRTFYRDLLREVRSLIGPNVFLSITALVSWCEPQSWLVGLPVDEIVPMAFRMGQAGPAVTSMLQSGGGFGLPGCRTAIGVSTADRSIPIRHGQRVYFFPDYQSWSPASAGAAFGRVPQ